ncbi:hypothetical protein CAEBREN_32317 [Caenorhabditis brenneri]|uniref:Uncharacterized protein n=1 Tax=Caenorhabditis brenneri TaxID=135651 RepID=G0N9C1_CAEBE|nr:hypothetical protein CAEBREN_32317 [Caenorhabditis brenneri]
MKDKKKENDDWDERHKSLFSMLIRFHFDPRIQEEETLQNTTRIMIRVTKKLADEAMESREYWK